jgi:flagellar biosynthesis/type III secretory pathway chaperone
MNLHELTDTLAAEAESLDRLAALLLEQRRTIAQADGAQLEDSAMQAHVLLRQLSESRRRREEIIARDFREPLPLTQLRARLGDGCPQPVQDQLARVESGAQLLRREAGINRRIIERSLRSGESLIRSLCHASDPASYGATGPTRASSLLLNQQV